MKHVIFLLCVIIQSQVSAKVYQMSTSECKFRNNIYKSLKVGSEIHCSYMCNKELCSRFIYDSSNKTCDLHSDEIMISNATETPPGKSLFLSAHKECNVQGYDFVESHQLCLKFYGDQYTWGEGRALCQQDGGDLLVLDKIDKWNFIYQHVQSCPASRTWLGLINGTWINGVPFQDMYGVTTVINSPSYDTPCGRMNLDGNNVLANKNCSIGSKVLCEIQIA